MVKAADSPPNDRPPAPPQRPGSDACCRGGCDPCVFELYEEELARYYVELRAWEEKNGRK